MNKYIEGDPRFNRVRRKKHSLVYLWCRKEFRNLSKAYNLGINVPKPFTFRKNVIIMEFFGEEGNPSPLIKDTVLKNYQKWYDSIMKSVKKLYLGGLVHADLSEFNILSFKNRPVIIDMAQSVLKEHPKAMQFLKKDVININNYFKKRCKVICWEEFIKNLL